jgi:hypothetical protein
MEALMASNYPKNVKSSIKNLEDAKVISPQTAKDFTPQDPAKSVCVPDMSGFKYDPVFTCILIDKSQSMASCQKDVLIAHREMINALRGSAITRYDSHCISQYLFAEDISPLGAATILATKENMDEVVILDDKNYTPDGGYTALYKSLYNVLQDVTALIESARDEGLSPKVTIGIITDGKDNQGEVDPAKIRSFLQEMKAKRILRSSVVVGLKSNDGLNEKKIEEIKTQIGFDEAITCNQSESRAIREAFRMASQSLTARLQQ